MKLTENIHIVDENVLKVLFMILYGYKSLVRADTCKQFILKCFQLIKEDDNPYFLALNVLPGMQKVKGSRPYPSYTLYNVNSLICTQFLVSFILLYKL